MRNYEIIAAALSLSARAHQKQLRKGSKTPYIVHPTEVGMLLIEEDQPDNVVAAGILHDVIEDTDVTEQELIEGFGPTVLKLVVEVSEEKGPGLNWEKRKTGMIHKVPTMSHSAQMIVCADKLSNIRSLCSDGRNTSGSVWDKFSRGKKEQKWYYEAMYEALSGLQETAIYRELGRYIERIFENKTENS